MSNNITVNEGQDNELSIFTNWGPGEIHIDGNGICETVTLTDGFLESLAASVPERLTFKPKPLPKNSEIAAGLGLGAVIKFNDEVVYWVKTSDLIWTAGSGTQNKDGLAGFDQPFWNMTVISEGVQA
jgi:hypothetical protein